MSEAFSLTRKEEAKLSKWQTKEEKILKEAAAQSGVPYHIGPIGGAYTYSFTPTTIGLSITVKHNVSGNKIDLTDYTEW